MPLTAPSIEIAGVTKTFGDKTAVDDVSFSAPPGELTYLLGPNGAGKSTLIRMIAGYAAPDAGTIAVNGGRLRDFAEVRREIGFGLNPFARDPKHSARRHLRWQARLAGLPRGEADRVLELVGLADVAGKLVGGFSFGMLQRLNIATALLGDPRTIVLDEPTNGLDVDGTLWLRELLTDYAADGRCLLVASHSLSEVAITADRVVVMGRGRVLTDATRDEVLALGSGPRPLEAAYLALTRESIDYRGNEVAR